MNAEDELDRNESSSYMGDETLSDNDIRTIEAMTRFGGSFVRHLGEAAKFADSENLNRIKFAFPEYWRRYEQLGIDKLKADSK